MILSCEIVFPVILEIVKYQRNDAAACYDQH